MKNLFLMYLSIALFAPVAMASGTACDQDELIKELPSNNLRDRMAQIFIHNVVDWLNSKNDRPMLLPYEKRTPLMLASLHGCADEVQILLDKGAKVDATTLDYRATPLVLASEAGHPDVIHILLDSGANIEGSEYIFGRTPLNAASREGHEDVVRLLLAYGADVHVKDMYHNTPMHHASRNGNINMAQLLIDHGADANAQNKAGFTPLISASSNGHIDMVRLLLYYGVDVDATSKIGDNACDTMAKKAIDIEKKVEISKLLDCSGGAGFNGPLTSNPKR